MIPTFKRFLGLLVCTGLAIGFCQSFGTLAAAAAPFGIGAHHTICYIVFLDETGSDIGDWNAMRLQASRVAKAMNSGDAVVVIAINDRGGDADNIRVPLQFLSVDSPLKVAELKRKRQGIVDQIMSLQPVGRPRRTDIVSAFRLAMDVGNKAITMAHDIDPHVQMDLVLAVFSDMQQTPKMPVAKDVTGIHFPNATKGYCFYVAAPGKNGIQSTVAIWKPLLNSIGIAITDNDFHQQGTVPAAISVLFPQSN